MKKMFALFAVLGLLAMSLTACSGGGGGEAPAENTPATNTESGS
jgi:ABC-type glycerol-3-phosphate transport system substrate-binding protein